MKGTIVTCLQALVELKFGKPGWQKVLVEAGMPATTVLMPTADVPDPSVLKLLAATCKVGGLTKEAAFDAFGDYWVNEDAGRMYSQFFKEKRNAKEFLAGMGQVHDVMTKSMPNAHPPKFRFEDKGPKMLVMEYSSSRNLADLLPGLIKGVARKYGERVSIKRQGANRFELTFA
jgi:hypothetical protein